MFYCIFDQVNAALSIRRLS